LRHGSRNGFAGALDINPEGESGPRAWLADAGRRQEPERPGQTKNTSGELTDRGHTSHAGLHFRNLCRLLRRSIHGGIEEPARAVGHFGFRQNWAVLMERRRVSLGHGRYAGAITTGEGFETLLRSVTLLGVSMLLLAGLAGCSAEQKELRRQVSPNQKLVAALMESILNDAAGSVREDIYINDQGIPLNLDKPVFSAVGCDHLSFEWLNDYTLQIHYETTCVISQFTNRWDRPSNVAAG
jgi:hypothetical protein